MSFHAPYRFRIVTEIQGHVIELVRFHRAICHSDEAFWLEGREDHSWVERPLLDRECITDRPRHKRPGTRITIKLNPDEDARLQARGLRQEYKT